MLECSVYGLLAKKPNKGIKFRRTERIYSDGIKTRIVVKDYYEDGTSINETILKETPDRNKQRISIVQKITKLNIKDSDLFLKTLGFNYIGLNTIEGYLYFRNGYKIEISRIMQNEDVVDSSEEDNLNENEIPEELLKYWLVKVFVETESITEGENMLEKAFQELNGEIDLIKPNLAVF
jgi:hypothetical protein